jgi:ABC-type glutathione transport system ATPase component
MRTEACVAGDRPILRVRALRKIYPSRGLFRDDRDVTAVDGVSLVLSRGRTLALVGESGCGKSTLARCVVRLEEFNSGEIRFQGADLLALRGEELRRARRRIQLIFQEPLEALNPRFSALDVVIEPLIISRDVGRREAIDRAHRVMELVGLPAARGSRPVQEFSGGQKQRLALARALITDPAVLIFDEALSGLDLSVQAQMVNLLLDLQATSKLAYLFISHDLRLVQALADEVAVMKDGVIVESGTVTDVFRNPQHGYTQKLFSTIPRKGIASLSEMAIKN